MRKAFTLLEVVISITIFTIILLFMYKVLDDTKLTNKKFEEHIYKNKNVNRLYKVIAEDIAESTGQITINKDKDKNSIVLFKSKNSFNNPFYSNITYLVSSNSYLIRIESKEVFQKAEAGLDFYKNAYIDVLLKDIEKFLVLKKDNKYVFVLKAKNKEQIVFPTFKIGE